MSRLWRSARGKSRCDGECHRQAVRRLRAVDLHPAPEPVEGPTSSGWRRDAGELTGRRNGPRGFPLEQLRCLPLPPRSLGRWYALHRLPCWPLPPRLARFGFVQTPEQVPRILPPTDVPPAVSAGTGSTATSTSAAAAGTSLGVDGGSSRVSREIAAAAGVSAAAAGSACATRAAASDAARAVPQAAITSSDLSSAGDLAVAGAPPDKKASKPAAMLTMVSALYSISSAVPSTTRPPLRAGKIKGFCGFIRKRRFMGDTGVTLRTAETPS